MVAKIIAGSSGRVSRITPIDVAFWSAPGPFQTAIHEPHAAASYELSSDDALKCDSPRVVRLKETLLAISSVAKPGSLCKRLESQILPCLPAGVCSLTGRFEGQDLDNKLTTNSFIPRREH